MGGNNKEKQQCGTAIAVVWLARQSYSKRGRGKQGEVA